MVSDKIQLEILGLSSSQSQSDSFALVLGEVNGKRRFPIIIGVLETQAIAIEIEEITPNRPLTHDLFKAFSVNFDIKILEIIISDLKEGVFFAQIVCESNGKKIEIDARPSDAIAIGLRFDVNIYSYESILTEVGIVLTENGEIVTVEEASAAGDELAEVKLEDQSIEKLKGRLKAALSAEDYEAAAKIRDELNHRN